jgi:hypothetical protein
LKSYFRGPRIKRRATTSISSRQGVLIQFRRYWNWRSIPAELIALDSESYAEFVSSFGALRTQIQQWRSVGDTSFHRIPGLRQLSPVILIRQALAKCPDAIPNVGTTDLDFITDPSLRESIRLDISTANSALANGEWKAAFRTPNSPRAFQTAATVQPVGLGHDTPCHLSHPDPPCQKKTPFLFPRG